MYFHIETSIKILFKIIDVLNVFNQTIFSQNVTSISKKIHTHTNSTQVFTNPKQGKCPNIMKLLPHNHNDHVIHHQKWLIWSLDYPFNFVERFLNIYRNSIGECVCRQLLPFKPNAKLSPILKINKLPLRNHKYTHICTHLCTMYTFMYDVYIVRINIVLCKYIRRLYMASTRTRKHTRTKHMMDQEERLRGLNLNQKRVDEYA